jgi:hypothetical protein
MTDHAFAGWHRPHPDCPWKKVCSGPSEYIVLSDLLDAVRGGDKMVVRSGVNPNDRQESIRRRRF